MSWVRDQTLCTWVSWSDSVLWGQPLSLCTQYRFLRTATDLNWMCCQLEFGKILLLKIHDFLLWNPQKTSCNNPGSKVHGANMGPIWGRQDPGGPHVGPMDLAIREAIIFDVGRMLTKEWKQRREEPSFPGNTPDRMFSMFPFLLSIKISCMG